MLYYSLLKRGTLPFFLSFCTLFPLSSSVCYFFKVVFCFLLLYIKKIMKIHEPGELIENAETAFLLLKQGNERFLKGELLDKGAYKADRKILKEGQKPFAAVLCCSDSRVAPEIFFDQKLGDIFVVRNAGNVADTTVLGSLEYAVEILQSKLIVVCGHTKCGAVMAACFHSDDLPPNIKHITDQIKPALKRGGDVEQVIRHNVAVMVEQIQSDEIMQRLGVQVIGACYDIHTGVVHWL
jgi:carbonic anhydrase